MMPECPQCGAENPDIRGLCHECGAELLRACPRCGAQVAARQRFCGECGHKLDGSRTAPSVLSAIDEELVNIRGYLPSELIERVLSQKSQIEGEHKQITVMFCDMEGFTSLSERMGPENTYWLMKEVFEIVIRRVHDYGGTVNDMAGDGVMALFGAPIALENAPERAIRSAVAIHRGMAEFSGRSMGYGEVPTIRMRIGIHTGPVVVGTLGNELRVKFAAVGDTVNLASRTQEMAEPGTTYVTAETFRLAEGFFRFEAMGEKAVKGKTLPVKVYRVIAPSTRRTRFDVAAERGLVPFIGRESELDRLVDGWVTAKAGRGQVLSIVGDAGLGKSRLLYEFRKAVSEQETTFLESRCLSYGGGTAYLPIVDLLKSAFDIIEGEQDDRIKEKVDRGLTALGVEADHTRPYILELLSVKDSGIDDILMSPEARRYRTADAVRRLAIKGSEMRPLALVVEDLHWIDRSSEEVLAHLADSISGSRILMIVTYRPDYAGVWMKRPEQGQISLSRLTHGQLLTMLSHLLGAGAVEQNLARLVLDKTEGNPFFVEEFVASLRESGMVHKQHFGYCLAEGAEETSLPSTIQDVIMARVDRVPANARAVLQAGSVVEREFGYELTKRVTGFPDTELLGHLSVLKDAGLIYERGVHPQSTYIFKHALTRDVVYDTILTPKKRSLHLAIAEAIEEAHRGNLDEQYALIAEHYLRGGEYRKAADYCRLAARKAEKSGALHDAIAYTRTRTTCLERLPADGEIERMMVDSRTALGLYYLQMTWLTEAKEAVEPIAKLTLKREYQRRFSQIHTIVGTYNYIVEEDYQAAMDYLLRALKIAEQLGDPLSIAMAHVSLGQTLCMWCRFGEGIYHFDKALEINLAANTVWGIAVSKAMLGGFAYNFQGKLDLGYEVTTEALKLAEESGDTYSKAYGHDCLGMNYYYRGLPAESEPHFLEAIALSEKIDFTYGRAVGLIHLGLAYGDMLDWEKAVATFDELISFLQQHRFIPSFSCFAEIALERVKLERNGQQVNLDRIRELYRRYRIEVLRGWLCRCVCDMLLDLREESLSEAEDWIGRAMEADAKSGMMVSLGLDHVAYSRLLQRKGAPGASIEHLERAVGILRECGAEGHLEVAEQALKDLQ